MDNMSMHTHSSIYLNYIPIHHSMSETEADRHYRLESSAACSESSHG